MFLAATQCGVSRADESPADNDATREANDRGDGASDAVLWEGVVNGRKIVWTSNDAAYGLNGEKTSLFKWLVNRAMAARCLGLTGENSVCGCGDVTGDACSNEFDYRLVSVFGNYATFEAGYFGTGETMLSATERSYRTVDLSVPRESPFHDGERVDVLKSRFYVRLDEMFDGKEILGELLKQDDMRENLKVFEVDVNRLKTAADLADLLERTNYKMFVEDNKYLLSKNFLDSWTIRGYSNEKANVVIRLTDARNDDIYTEIPMMLSVSAQLRPALEKAASNTEGFLGEYAEKTFNKNATRYDIKP